MSNEEFLERAKLEVCKYHNDRVDTLKGENDFIDCAKDVYIVWSCKTLQNSKALLSTTVPDGMYYEVTMNGDKQEIYFDAYKKVENKCIKIESEDK